LNRRGLTTASAEISSPIALRVPLHHPRSAPDHEAAGRLLNDRSRERCAGQFERAADRQRFFALHAIVRSWGLSGAILLDPSLSGFDPAV
jgi:hypothetical protein